MKKKADKLKLALEVNRIAAQRIDVLTGDLEHFKEKNHTLEDGVQQLYRNPVPRLE